MHALIAGMTESGKSTLGIILAKQLRDKGKKVVVLDPLCDPRWHADFRSDNIDELTEYLKVNHSCYVFVDESGSYFNEGNDQSNNWLATRSRHYGHSVFFLAQRAVQIPRTMRDQCNRLFLFTSSSYDGKIHSEEWNNPKLEECNKLPKLTFLRCHRYDVCERMKLVNYKEIAYDSGSDDSDTGNVDGIRRNGSTSRKMGSGKGKARQ